MSGHDHNYQRFAPVDGVTYVISVGGGDALYGLDDECSPSTPTRMAYNDDLNHFIAISASKTQLRIVAIAADGTVLDRFFISSR